MKKYNSTVKKKKKKKKKERRVYFKQEYRKHRKNRQRNTENNWQKLIYSCDPKRVNLIYQIIYIDFLFSYENILKM